MFTGFHLIAYIRSWQNALNEAAAQEGLKAFQFNTYIISVLVIFFLQMNKIFPKLKDLPPSKSKCIDHIEVVGNDKLRQLVNQFFEFYGKKYQMGIQLISINIGRWQERQLPAQQTILTPEQTRYTINWKYSTSSLFLNIFKIFPNKSHDFSLREGISLNRFNWENCTMFVQDIKASGVNIAAEISKEEAYNFKKLCQLFSSDSSHKSFIDEYMSKLCQMQPASKVGSTLSLDSADSTKEFDELSISSRLSIHNSNGGFDIPRSSNATKKLEDVVEIEQVAQAISAGIIEITSRTTARVHNEKRIVTLLTQFLKVFDPTLEVISFGSATYGFGGAETNFNILVNTGEIHSTFLFNFSYFIGFNFMHFRCFSG